MAKKPGAKRGQELVAFARQLQQAGCNWLQAHNALYGPGGKFAELFPMVADRTSFSGSAADQELQMILEALPEPVEQSTREASGKLVVRMPKSLHQALISEAEAEGISLNQLIVSKLTVQLRTVVH